MNKFKGAKEAYFLLLSIFLLAISSTPAQANEKQQAAVISAIGSSLQEIAPDACYIILEVQTDSETSAEAQAQNAKITNHFIEQSLAAGIKEKDIKTTSYRISPIYKNTEPGSRKKPVIIGYSTVNTMSVYLPAEKTGQVMDLAVKSGVTQILDLRFTLKNDKKIVQDTVSLAVMDAMNKIEAIAKTLDKRIVRVQSVELQHSSMRSPGAANMAVAYAPDVKQAYSESAIISPGTVNVSASVRVVVEIE